MIVDEIWRYPVKSMGGERLQHDQLGELGVVGDRGWGVLDKSTGLVLTARRSPALLFASATVDDTGAVTVSLPDGTEVREGPQGDAALSEWLVADVQLRRAGENGGTYENPMNVVDDDDWVTWQGPGGAWHDSARARVSLVSRATLRDWDVRRFRTNLVVHSAGSVSGDEDDLVGSSIELGSCRLDVIKPIDRCVMVTRPQPGLERDLSVLQTINRERASSLSVGALVARGGVISIGDAVLTRPLDDPG